MKKFYLLTALLLSTMCIMAQKPSKFTITPRVGLTVSTFTGPSTEYIYAARSGAIAGADAEYKLNNTFGISAGLFYNLRSVKEYSEVFLGFKKTAADNNSNPFLYNENPYVAKVAVGKGGNINFNREEFKAYRFMYDVKGLLHYISLPVLLHAHVWQGLSVKAGVQCNYLLTAKAKYTTETYIDGKTTYTNDSKTITDSFKRVTLDIPIGISYSYKNMELDARYLWGVSKVGKKGINYDGSSLKNSTFAISLGYNFEL